ncbi:MAG TPA: NAD(P)H-quinone oxidoreductase [Pyrinomonadaceae bacterium]|jgi:putative PIG3 family NAD(P)H quinone oxidoreductase
MSGKLMRAVSIDSHGGVESLSVREVARPGPPTANRVLVRVSAAGLNRADILQRMGRYPAPAGAAEQIPGLEFAGSVEQVGEEVRASRVDQRVFGITAGGAQAEYVLVPEDVLVEIPENLDWAEAAAVPEVFITAHDALFTQCALGMGERLLVHAAGSGVGTAAVQLAHAAGALVYGTSRTALKLERARAFGLDEGVAIGNDASAFARAVRGWTNEAGVNVILDLVGGAYLSANLDALAPEGRLIFVGTTGGQSAELNLAVVMSKRLRLMGTVLRARSAEEKARATRLFAAHVCPLLASGKVRPVVDRVFPLDEVRAAHERMESNESFGKIVLLISETGK